MRRHFALLTVILLLLYPALVLAQGKILNVRHWTAPDNTRIVIETTDNASYRVEQSEGKVTLDLIDFDLPRNIPREISLMRSGVKRFTVTAMAAGVVRIEVFLMEGTVSNVFKLKGFQEKPERVILDVLSPDVEKQLSLERQQIKAQKKYRVVVIDPGHGGEDPGAVGKKGALEKDVVLDISRALRDIINQENGYRAFLTRDGDYFVPFKKRMKIARDYDADLFLSIHTNASRNRNASGSSVYSLSSGGAVSEAARILARRENLADIIGGVPHGEALVDETQPIILNMFQNNTINISKTFGASLLARLGEIVPLQFRSVQEAPFVVLRLPEIPAVLIETLFISNPREEKLLKTRSFRESMARQIALAVYDFLPATSLALSASVTNGEIKEVLSDAGRSEPPVKSMPDKGNTEDVLKAIIQGQTSAVNFPYSREYKDKRNRTADSSLKIDKSPPQAKVSLKDDRSRSKIGNKRPDRPIFYRVRKGDTLGKIAARFNVAVKELAKINGIRVRDPLHVNRKLKIPR